MIDLLHRGQVRIFEYARSFDLVVLHECIREKEHRATLSCISLHFQFPRKVPEIRDTCTLKQVLYSVIYLHYILA